MRERKREGEKERERDSERQRKRERERGREGERERGIGRNRVRENDRESALPTPARPCPSATFAAKSTCKRGVYTSANEGVQVCATAQNATGCAQEYKGASFIRNRHPRTLQ